MNAAQRRKKELLVSAQEFHFSAESSTFNSMMPRNAEDPLLFRSSWHPDSLREMFVKARSLLKYNDFFGAVHRVKLCYFADGFRYEDEGRKLRKWRETVAKLGLSIDRLNMDVWSEFLMCDSAIVFWRTPQNGVATPVVLDCEICEYSDALGSESLKVKPARCKLTAEQRAALGKRWADALEKGGVIEIDRSAGENFRVLTWSKLGSGLGWPRLGQILDKLGARELLEIADWGAAWESGDLYRQIKKGHAITQGEHAGESRHFITKKQSDKIKSDTKGKRGPRTLVSNFDVDVSWKYLDPRFFDEKKYAAVMAKLRVWAGAPALIYESGQAAPNLMSAFGVEGRVTRRLVGPFIASIVNDPTFYGSEKPPEPVRVGYNEQSFMDTKMMLEWVRAGASNGLISPQTARSALGVDNEVEGDRLEEAAQKPARYRPVFEAKQGMLVDKGGRPSDKPGAETPPTGPKD